MKGVIIGTGNPTASLNMDDDDVMGELSRGEVDGLFRPICYEAWSSGGDHRVSCLPCGHIYGLSCIKKWLGRHGSSKCPQCKNKCHVKDIRLLYATRVVAIDEELQKKVQSLEARCASLEKKNQQPPSPAAQHTTEAHSTADDWSRMFEFMAQERQFNQELRAYNQRVEERCLQMLDQQGQILDEQRQVLDQQRQMLQMIEDHLRQLLDCQSA